jgi:hypothetical protein
MEKLILFIGSESPKGKNIGTREQQNVILKALLNQNKYTLLPVLPVIETFWQELRSRNYSILHFSGHGCDDGKGLIFLDPTRSLDYATDPTYDRFIQNIYAYQNDENFPYIECVCLVACNSYKICEDLKKNIFCVIGMNRDISDKEGLNFVKNFYSGLSGIELSNPNRYREALNHAITNLEQQGNKDFIYFNLNPDLNHTISSNNQLRVNEQNDMRLDNIPPKALWYFQGHRKRSGG